MPFYIKPFGDRADYCNYADHDCIRQYFGFRRGQKLPINFSMNAWQMKVPLKKPTAGGAISATLFVNPGTEAAPGRVGWRSKSSKHRVFAICPDCSKAVPAGRTHQHKCK